MEKYFFGMLLYSYIFSLKWSKILLQEEQCSTMILYMTASCYI